MQKMKFSNTLQIEKRKARESSFEMQAEKFQVISQVRGELKQEEQKKQEKLIKDREKLLQKIAYS